MVWRSLWDTLTLLSSQLAHMTVERFLIGARTSTGTSGTGQVAESLENPQ